MRVQACDVIYIRGGNPFFLLQELNRTGAVQAIVELVQAGKVYVGESVGAAILSPDVRYMDRLDEVAAAPSLDSTRALGLVGDYPLLHCGNSPFKDTVEAVLQAYQGQLKLQATSNQQSAISKRLSGVARACASAVWRIQRLNKA